MPTKPLTQPEAWATNALYTTGPFIGSASKVVPAVGIAAEGHRPGSLFPTAAEHENSQQNRITALARWLFLGTSDPDVDAHVVETNAGGRAGLHGLDITNLLDQIALTITSNAVTFPAVYALVTTGATVFQTDLGNSDGIAYEALVKAGSFPVGFKATMTGSDIGARGVQVSADAATDGLCIGVRHEGGGSCAEFTHVGQPLSLSAVVISAIGPGNARGLDVIGAGILESLRVRSSSTPSGNGIFADMLNATGFALRARTTAAATSASRAVRAEGRGSATGAECTADAGDALRVQAIGAAGTAIFHPGRATDSTTTFNGHLDFNTTTSTWTHSDQDAGNYRDFWSSRGGIAIGNSTGGQTTTNNSAVAYVTAATLALTGQDAPHRAGVKVILRFSCDARSLVAATNTLDVIIYDTTEAPDVVVAERSGVGVGGTDGYFLAVATTSWQRAVALDVVYTIPAAGARTFIAQVKTATANGIQVRDAKLVPFGCMP